METVIESVRHPKAASDVARLFAMIQNRNPRQGSMQCGCGARATIVKPLRVEASYHGKDKLLANPRPYFVARCKEHAAILDQVTQSFRLPSRKAWRRHMKDQEHAQA